MSDKIFRQGRCTHRHTTLQKIQLSLSEMLSAVNDPHLLIYLECFVMVIF